MKIYKNIVLIGRGRETSVEYDGGEYGAYRIEEMVSEIFSNIKRIQILRPNMIQRARNLLLNEYYGKNQGNYKKIKSITRDMCDLVIFNGSIYGSAVEFLKERGFTIATLYHNVEATFYHEKYLQNTSVSNYLMYRYIQNQERLCTKFSDIIITLNNRDSEDLHRKYNKRAAFYIPISYPLIDDNLIKEKTSDESYLLFVGGNNFANIEGIKRFVRDMLPSIDFELKICGNCCKQLEKDELFTKNIKVKMLGFVDDIDNLYYGATAVIEPIYRGSGMKTKTVEALQHGKTIFGTHEAFEGIDVDYGRVGALCNTPEEFINSINDYLDNRKSTFNAYSYQCFKQRYSTQAVNVKFRDNMQRLIGNR